MAVLLSAAISVGPVAFTPLAAATGVQQLKDEAISLTPGSGPAGTKVQVYGTGFEACDAAKLGVENGTTTTAYVKQATHTLSGTVTIPEGTKAGPVEIVADCSPSADYASATFTVTDTGCCGEKTPEENLKPPAISLDKSEGPPGTQFTVTGSGFGKCYAQDVELYVGENKLLNYRIDVSAEQGSFSEQATVFKDAAPGTYQIRAVCVGFPDISASAPFTVTDTTTTAHPKLSLSKSEGEKGTPVQADGTGFTCPDVELSWDDGGVLTPATVTDGGFSTGITIPADAKPGAHKVQAVCTAYPEQAAEAPFNVTETATENGGTENGGTENGGTENGGTENGGTENGGTENGGTENGGTENGGTENGGTENGGTENGGTENGGTENGGTENGGTENGGTENGGTENGGTENGGTTTGGDSGGSATPVGLIVGPASLGGALAIAVAAGAYFGRLHRGPRWVRGHVKATLRPVTGTADLTEERRPGDPPTHTTRLDPHPDPGRQTIEGPEGPPEEER